MIRPGTVGKELGGGAGAAGGVGAGLGALARLLCGTGRVGGLGGAGAIDSAGPAVAILLSGVAALGRLVDGAAESGGVACFADVAGCCSGTRGAEVDGAEGTAAGRVAVATGPVVVDGLEPINQATIPRLVRITAAATQNQTRRPSAVAAGLVATVDALTCVRSRSAFLSASRM
jgi:hypothetical protein